MERFKIFAAPLQGYTNAPFRHFHADLFGGVDAYYSPFIRVEDGDVRRRDLIDLMSPLNANHCLVPQIIFKDELEFSKLVDRVESLGFNEVDLNLGCPFPPQLKRGRGAALIVNPDILQKISDIMVSLASMRFSLKMRIGVSAADDWRESIGVINNMPLQHITVHPRIAAQGYDGRVDIAQFERILGESSHPVIYNGDILSAEGIGAVISRFPSIAGVMIGRGLLRSPAIASDWTGEAPAGRRSDLTRLLMLHEPIYTHYCETLCGESQILSKIKPFWDYAKPELPNKMYKAIKKASSLSKYEMAVSSVAKIGIT